VYTASVSINWHKESGESSDFHTGTLTVKEGEGKSAIYAKWELVKQKSGSWDEKYGSPLADDRVIDGLADAYGSTGFLNFGHTGFLNFGSSGNFGHTGFLNFDSSGNFGHTGFLNFDSSGDRNYGSVGFLDVGTGTEITTDLNFGTSQSALPPSL
jgi:hypothetical protein